MSSDQQKEIRPFTFEHSFDVLMTPEEEEAAKKQEEEEAAPTFSEEELAAAREEAFQSGLQAGRQEVITGIEQQVSATLEVLSATIGRIGEQQSQANDLIARESVELAVAAVRKLFPNLAKRGGKEEVEKFVADIMSRLLEEPHLSIRVSETLAPEIERHFNDLSQQIGFAGKILISPDADLGPADCRIRWSEGEAEKLTETILQEIETLTGSLPRPTAPSMEIATDAAQGMPNEIPANAAPSQEPEIFEQPMPPIEPDVATAPPEPSVPPEPIAEATDVPDIHEVPTEVLSAGMPSPDMAATPEFTAEPVSENEMTDENRLLRKPQE